MHKRGERRGRTREHVDGDAFAGSGFDRAKTWIGDHRHPRIGDEQNLLPASRRLKKGLGALDFVVFVIRECARR